MFDINVRFYSAIKINSKYPNGLYVCISRLKKITWILFILLWTTSCEGLNSRKTDVPNAPIICDREKRVGSPGGIPNLGDTCYMNVVLQILKTFYLDKINEKNDELGKALQALMQVIKDNKEIANEAEATAVFNALEPTFNWPYVHTEGGGDPAILLYDFFDWMELPPSIVYRFVDPTTKQETAVTNKVFDPITRQERTVAWWFHTVNPGNTSPQTMQELFDNSLKPETVLFLGKSEEEHRGEIIKEQKLKNLDNLHNGILVLIRGLYIDYIDCENETFYRAQKKIEGMMKLTIKKDQTVDKTEDKHYKLVGFIHGAATPRNNRHTIAYTQKEDIWTCYDDNCVSTVSATEAEANATGAYLLFYKPDMNP